MMTKEEQIKICKAISASCMWGHGGIGSVIIEKLDKTVKCADKWADVFKSSKKQGEYDAVGVISNEDELRRKISDGYTIHNYKSGELSVFRPRIYGGGLHMYVLGELADKYGKIYDPHNFEVYEYRKKHGIESYDE